MTDEPEKQTLEAEAAAQSGGRRQGGAQTPCANAMSREPSGLAWA